MKRKSKKRPTHLGGPFLCLDTREVPVVGHVAPRLENELEAES
jgi:hypothetical protein